MKIFFGRPDHKYLPEPITSRFRRIILWSLPLFSELAIWWQCFSTVFGAGNLKTLLETMPPRPRDVEWADVTSSPFWSVRPKIFRALEALPPYSLSLHIAFEPLYPITCILPTITMLHLIYSNFHFCVWLQLAHFGQQYFSFSLATFVQSNHCDFRMQDNRMKQGKSLLVVHSDGFWGLVSLQL